MALSTCFLRPVTLRSFLYQQMRVAVVPCFKTNLPHGSFSKSTLAGPKMVPLYSPVKSISTTMVRRYEEKPHDHARLWVIEKGTTVLLLFLIPCGLLVPNKLIDCILSVLITAHAHWGMEALVVEYIRVLLFGPALPKLAMTVVYSLTALLLGGLFYLSLNDIGMCRAFWRIWRNMRKPTDSGGTAPGSGYDKCTPEPRCGQCP